MAEVIAIVWAGVIFTFAAALFVSFCIATAINIGRHVACKIVGRDEL